MTAVEPYVCDEAEARALTEQIKGRAEQTWLLIERAYQHRAWSALGYASWDAYCSAEFGTTRLRLPREDRQGVVASLRESGMSLRAISAATGDSLGTVHHDLAGVQNRTPDPASDDDVVDAEIIPDPPAPVLGVDGKTYPATAPPRAPRAPRTDVVAVISRALSRAQDAAHSASYITRAHLAARSEEAAVWSRDLSTSLQALQRLLDALQEASK